MGKKGPEPFTLAGGDLLRSPTQPLDMVRRTSEQLPLHGGADAVELSRDGGCGCHLTLRSGSTNPSARDSIWDTTSRGRAAGFAAHSRTMPDPKARMNSAICRSGRSGLSPVFAQRRASTEVKRSTVRAWAAA